MQKQWITVSCLAFACCGCGTRSERTPVKLTLLGFGLETGKQLREDALNDFTARSGIEVDVIPTLGTSSEQLRPLLGILQKRVSTPDLFLVDVIWPGTLASHLLDLRPYMDHASRDHMPALLRNSTIENRVTALPFYVSTGVLFYRTDLLKKYGYDHPPTTWDNLDAMADVIQRGERRRGRTDFWGFVWQGAAYEGLTCNALEWQTAYGGGGIVERDGMVSVNNEGTIAAMTKAANRIDRISPPGVLSYTESDSSVVFRSGRAAFLRHWSSAYPGIAAGRMPGTVGIAPMPAGPSRRTQSVGGFYIAVSAYSKHPAEAARLALYLTGRDVQRRRALRRGYMPTLLELRSDPELLAAMPQMAALRSVSDSEWVSRPSAVAGPKYADVSRAYYEAVHDILARKVSPGPALQELDRLLTRIVGLEQGKSQ